MGNAFVKAEKPQATNHVIASALALLALPAHALASEPVPPASTPVTPSGQATAPVSGTSPDGFAVGVDTIETVEAKRGKPFTTTTNPDGTIMVIYTATKTHVKGATFIPIAGLFAGGAKGHITSKMFFFDSKGVLSSFSSSETNVDCRTGLGVNCH
jgi:hypothetical protein